MSDRTWLVDVEISSVVRRTITLTVNTNLPLKGPAKLAAEAEARAAVRQLEHDELPDGYNTFRWSVDNATAIEMTS